MRFHEIIEATSASRISAAQTKKAEAARDYQERLRTIAKTAPSADVRARQARAREVYQRRIRAADSAIRSALAANRTSA